MSDLLDTALILARRGDTDALVELLQNARRWRDTSADVTEAAIVEALGYQPAAEGSTAGAAARYEFSARWPGLVTANAKPVDVPFHDPYTVDALLIDADAGPDTTYDFEVLTGGTLVQTVTLSSALELFQIGSAVAGQSALVCRSGETSDATQLAGVTFSFKLTPA